MTLCYWHTNWHCVCCWLRDGEILKWVIEETAHRNWINLPAREAEPVLQQLLLEQLPMSADLELLLFIFCWSYKWYAHHLYLVGFSVMFDPSFSWEEEEKEPRAWCDQVEEKQSEGLTEFVIWSPGSGKVIISVSSLPRFDPKDLNIWFKDKTRSKPFNFKKLFSPIFQAGTLVSEESEFQLWTPPPTPWCHLSR